MALIRLFSQSGQPSQHGMVERAWTSPVDMYETTIRGERQRSFGKFERAVTLPIPVETGAVKATYRDGVLTAKLPKTEGVKPKEIRIDAV
jgi:hypothetical protein